MQRTAKGQPIVQSLALAKDESISAILDLTETSGKHLFLISAASAESEFIAELPTAFVKRISIQIEVPGSIKTCNNCGKVSYGDDRFCAGCGEKLG